MLDNDMIRLQQKKLDTVLQMKENERKKMINNRVSNAVVGALFLAVGV